MPRVAWDNAAHSLLERTLDDSANRRSLLPEAFLIADELLISAKRTLAGLNIDHEAIILNLNRFAPFAATERVLMALGKAGADRQDMHERLRVHSMHAWQALQAGGENPLLEELIQDEVFSQYIPVEDLRELMDVRRHTGNASQRALALAQTLREALHSP
jgi:adenylosuccinate lyase